MHHTVVLLSVLYQLPLAQRSYVSTVHDSKDVYFLRKKNREGIKRGKFKDSSSLMRLEGKSWFAGKSNVIQNETLEKPIPPLKKLKSRRRLPFCF